jgi:phosphonate transport system substrate-binding protein
MSDSDSGRVEQGTDDASTLVRATDGVNRRNYLRGGALAVAASVGLAGCSGGGGDGGDGGNGGGGDGGDGGSSGTTVGSSQDYPPVTFIETPGNQPANTRKQWKPFTDYLVDEVDGLEMEISFAQSYSAVGQALLNGQAHITSGDLVMLANPDKLDVLGIKVENGAKVYFSLIGTLPKYDIDELTDLKGETVAFADRLSTSGSLFATFALKQAGLDIGEAPYGDPVDYTGEWSNHDAAKQTVINREDVVALGTYAGNIMDHIPKDQFPDRVKEQSGEWGDSVGTKSPEMRLLHASAPIPKSPLIAPSDWEHPLRSDIEETILSIDEGDLEEPADVELAITSIADGSVDDYQPVIDVINELDIDFGDL